MTDNITLVGVIATPPKSMRTASGLSILSFRLASSQRRYDRARSEWVDGDTNWYTVTAFRQLADHGAASLSKGDRVIVAGRQRVRAWESGDRSGTTVEIDADSLGPDLLFGTTSFTRTTARSNEQPAQDHEVPTDSAPPASPPDSGFGEAPAPERELVGAVAGSTAAVAPGAAASSGGLGAADSIGAPAPLGTVSPGIATSSGAASWHPSGDEAPF